MENEIKNKGAGQVKKRLGKGKRDTTPEANFINMD